MSQAVCLLKIITVMAMEVTKTHTPFFTPQTLPPIHGIIFGYILIFEARLGWGAFLEKGRDERRKGEDRRGQSRSREERQEIKSKCMLHIGTLKIRLHLSKDTNSFEKRSFRKRVSEKSNAQTHNAPIGHLAQSHLGNCLPGSVRWALSDHCSNGS